MKRALDLAVAIPGLILASPVIAVAAAAVKLESRGPAFYRGDRVGRLGRRFHIVKLRSMVSKGAGPAVTSADDPRITRVGRFLRRTKVDELPQLWNVIRGDMSLVGPRPESPEFVNLYTPEQRRVLSVRPGITSPTSLEFHDEEKRLAEHGGAASYAETVMPLKLERDLEYIDHQSMGADLKVIAQTIAFTVGRWRRQ